MQRRSTVAILVAAVISVLSSAAGARDEPKRKPKPLVWETTDCSAHVSIKNRLTREYGEVGQSVDGVVRNDDKLPVKKLKICAEDKCKAIGFLAPGQEFRFVLNTDHMRGKGDFDLTTECSVLDRPGD
ncbi:MAG: hypothetical protein ACREQQ_11725 [Candidatus Binatia bacterium]